MKTYQSFLVALALIVISCVLTLPARAQLPNYNQVCLGGPATENLSDTLSAYGLTATWTLTSNSLVCTFTGIPERATNWITLTWYNTSAAFPLVCQVTSTTEASYDFEASQNDGAWDHSLNSYGLTGDFAFGQQFPALEQLDIFVRPNQIGQTYDLTITMAWGEGTPAEAQAFGSIKTLYR